MQQQKQLKIIQSKTLQIASNDMQKTACYKK